MHFERQLYARCQADQDDYSRVLFWHVDSDLNTSAVYQAVYINKPSFSAIITIHVWSTNLQTYMIFDTCELRQPFCTSLMSMQRKVYVKHFSCCQSLIKMLLSLFVYMIARTKIWSPGQAVSSPAL